MSFKALDPDYKAKPLEQLMAEHPDNPGVKLLVQRARAAGVLPPAEVETRGFKSLDPGRKIKSLEQLMAEYPDKPGVKLLVQRARAAGLLPSSPPRPPGRQASSRQSPHADDRVAQLGRILATTCFVIAHGLIPICFIAFGPKFLIHLPWLTAWAWAWTAAGLKVQRIARAPAPYAESIAVEALKWPVATLILCWLPLALLSWNQTG